MGRYKWPALALGLIAAAAGVVAWQYAQKPVPPKPIPISRTSPAASTPAAPAVEAPERIAQRWQEAQRGQFPIIESDISIFPTFAQAEGEVLSQLGEFALTGADAQHVEQEESWGIAGATRNELAMYVHNATAQPITSMVVSLSEGACEGAAASNPPTWMSFYLGEPIAPGNRALLHFSLAQSLEAPAYCAVVTRVYGSRDRGSP